MAQKTCTVPTIANGVANMSGTNCASGASTVVAGTTCAITAAPGYACTNPGLCGADGNFAATGECKAAHPHNQWNRGEIGRGGGIILMQIAPWAGSWGGS